MTAASPRRVAFDVLRHVTGGDAYANLALSKGLATAGLDPRDNGFVTELVAGTCRLMGTHDRIIEAASGRKLSSLQPAVVDLLRLGSHQALAMKVPVRAAVASTVDLARATVGQRVTGLVNAVMRKVGAKSLDEWTALLAANEQPLAALATTAHHPSWIAGAYADLLPADEVADALAANNVAPVPTLVVRPSLAEVAELVSAGAEATQYSPFGAVFDGNPSTVPAVSEGRAGVQDEGSQLVALALATVDAPDGAWLDLCAGPGGKAALLAGLASQRGETLLANEVAPHRADLVRQALACYPEGVATVDVGDGRVPPARRSFARVMADVPCTGLGALRRRPESRWRRSEDSIDELRPLQEHLLRSALESAVDGGVVAYATCSPHRRETRDVVDAVLAGSSHEVLDAPTVLGNVPDAADGRFVQLWTHRHGTDAMFLALIRVHHDR